MNTGIIMGSHIDFKRGIWKYGSVQAMPQFPVIERFAKEGNVTVFSCDSDDYTSSLPENCKHVRLYSRLLFILFSWLMISLVSRQENIKYFYYHSGSSIFGLPFVNRLSSAKTILFYGVMLNANADGLKHNLYYAFERWSLRYVDYIILGSDEIRGFIDNSDFNGKFLPINKGVRLPKPDNRIKKTPERVIWCGRLEPVKDPITAMKAFKKHVLPRHPKAELVMCGDGTLRVPMEFEALDFEDNISIMGQRHDMPVQFQKSGLFLISSLYEGSPDVALEAMAVGLPIISTDVGGVRNYIKDNENGLIVKDEQEMGVAMNYLIENPRIAEHMGQIGKERAWDKHDLARNTDMLLKLLSKYDRGRWE